MNSGRLIRVKFYSTGSKSRFIPLSGTYPLGFKVGGQHIGIKKDGKTLDLALLISDKPCSAAAVFTKNSFKAAPVLVSKHILSKSNEGIRAIVINSGCANAVTGESGIHDAEMMASCVDKIVGKESSTLVMSTGVIGQRLDINKVSKGIPKLFNKIGSSHQHWFDCASAICTTDTFPKLRSLAFDIAGKEVRIAGVAKGAGMIHPNMATLLSFVVTDASISPSAVQNILSFAVDKSFNSITIDGDTSTNDTVALLANSETGGPVIEIDSPEFIILRDRITDLFQELAHLVVRDGEGATKFDAKCDEDAKKAASAVARSPLVKTALFGEDANWGRVLAAVGYSGVDVDPQKAKVSFISGKSTLVLLEHGEPVPISEDYAKEILKQEDVEIKVSLGINNGGKARMWTCDFSHQVSLSLIHNNIKYISINADYRT